MVPAFFIAMKYLFLLIMILACIYSVLGSALMVLGLYLVLWGKKRDEISLVSCATNNQADEEADNKQ
jgi:hypothetical protein